MAAAIALTLVAIALIVGLAILIASAQSGESGPEGEFLTIVSKDGNISRLSVEIADTPEERSQGLSGREEVPPDTGMLFVIPTRGNGFWMKDTLVPLSVAFIAECGEIVDIQDMEPLSLDIHDTEQDYAYGLETPQGWFDTNGVTTGDLVSIPRDIRPGHC